MKKHYFLTALLGVIFILEGLSQVPRTIIVEHTTNTRCSICSNRNPRFYGNLKNFPEILHIAYHPSSPYSNCVLNQHNPSQNDGRTMFYNIFGGTPRIVINGSVQSPGTNYSDPSIFTPFQNQMSDYSIDIQESRTQDSVIVNVTIQSVSASATKDARIYLAYAEDTVFYQAPNGESEHFDVFRRAFTGDNGDNITLPAAGNSLSLRYAIPISQVWDMDRMFAVGILQERNTFDVLQASSNKGQGPTTGINQVFEGEFNIFPNPVLDVLRVQINGTDKAELLLYDLTGKLQKRADSISGGTQIDLSDLPVGVYMLQMLSEDGVAVQKVVKN